jgi:tetratricopeptide (TPR) repeat protein
VAVAKDVAALAALVQEQHRLEEAEQLYQRAIAILEDTFEPVHYELAVNYNNLAAVYASRGNPQQAEQLYRRALDIKIHLLGPGHPDVAVSLHNLATLAVGQGDNDRAHKLFERAVGILETSLGAAHPRNHYQQNPTRRSATRAARCRRCCYSTRLDDEIG